MKKIFKLTVAIFFIFISALSNSATPIADLEEILNSKVFDAFVTTANRPSGRCQPVAIELYELLVSRKDNRAQKLSPIIGLCSFDPMLESYKSLDNSQTKPLSQRTTDFVSAVREYNGEQMAISAERFMDEVVLPMRESIIKNNGDHSRDIVLIDNALKYSSEKKFPEPFIIFLTKTKNMYYLHAK